MRGMSSLIFSENCQKISTTNTQICTFIKTFKGKGTFLSSSLDSLLSSACKNDFTISVAQSVQALWPIITAMATQAAGAVVKGF